MVLESLHALLALHACLQLPTAAQPWLSSPATPLPAALQEVELWKRNLADPPVVQASDFVLTPPPLELADNWLVSRGSDPLLDHATFHYDVIRAVPQQQNRTRVHVVRLLNPLHHWFPVAPQGEDGACPGRISVHEAAERASCRVAMNAGFFQVRTGDCVGNIVCQGRRVQISGLGYANFGLLTNGSFVVGYVSEQDLWQLPIANLISGVLWLVRDGREWIRESVERERPEPAFIDLIAARTMVGHDAFGSLYMVMAEGDSFAAVQLGLTAWQMAQLALELGLVNVVNLDGGGSATIWWDGQERSRSSNRCWDAVSDRFSHCARLVSSILCIR